jgi:hypothetical protein
MSTALAMSSFERSHGQSRQYFESIVSFLDSKAGSEMDLSQLERELKERGLELMRRLPQEHLDRRAPGHCDEPVRGADGIERMRVRPPKGEKKNCKRMAKEKGVELTIVIDIIHVTEYLWKAGRAFHPKSGPEPSCVFALCARATTLMNTGASMRLANTNGIIRTFTPIASFHQHPTRNLLPSVTI